VDREGNLWLGMDDVGLEMLCRGCDRFAHFPNRPGDPGSVGADTLNTVFEDRDGTIWAGLRPGGLARLDRATGRFEHYRADPKKPASLSHDTVSALYQDRAGRFWVGTQGGGIDQMLRAADGSVSFRGYTAKHGLGSDAIGGIAEDRGGRIWVSTSTGISRLEPDTGRITNYDRRDGAQARGYYIGATGLMADGRVVFGGLRGATVFDPDQVGADRSPRAVAITSIRGLEGASDQGASVAGWQADAQGPWLKLPHSTDAFAAEFSALHFSAPHRVRYSYRLSGLGEQWIETDSRRRIAMYTGLPPGEFRFEVRARSGDGPWSEATAVRVRHMPSPWQTLWARAALVLVLAAATGALGWELRSRLRERRHSEKRLKQSEERLKLALWGSGNELWDMDLVTHSMRRSNPLQHVEVTADDYVADVRDMRRTANAEDLAGFDRAFGDHVSGRSEYMDAVYRVRDLKGEWRWLRSRGRIVQRDPEGKALRMVGTTEDITALKEHELALERINQDLERRVRDRTGDLTLANEQLTRTVEELRQAQRQLVDAEKMAALGGLVAGIAHEINTPLGISVTAASHLESEARRIDKLRASGALQRGELEAYQQLVADSTQMILRNLQRADKLVKSFKQVAVDQSSEQRRNIDLSEYLEEILTSLHPALKRTRHTVIVDCPEPIVLHTYPGAIYQIVVNLAMNSLLHGFEGVDHGTISIRLTREAGSWLMDYRDDGRGMTEEVRRRVFEPFFTTKRGQGGSGLRLHIVFNLDAPGAARHAALRVRVRQGRALRAALPDRAGALATLPFSPAAACRIVSALSQFASSRSTSLGSNFSPRCWVM
jgi:signal transduction histidine kinase/streptogramin lyase